jgi:hypothetical protein
MFPPLAPGQNSNSSGDNGSSASTRGKWGKGNVSTAERWEKTVNPEETTGECQAGGLNMNSRGELIRPLQLNRIAIDGNDLLLEAACRR